MKEQSLHKVFTVLALLIMVATSAQATQEKVGNANVTVGKTTTIDLPQSAKTTLAQATVSYLSWTTTTDSNIKILSSTQQSCTIKGLNVGSAKLYFECHYWIDGNYRTFDYYFDISILYDGGPTYLNVSPTSITLEVGETCRIVSEQGEVAGWNWFTTDDPNVATVTRDSQDVYLTYGTITAVSPGTTYITVHNMRDMEASCKVTVNGAPIEPTSITLSDSWITLYEGETRQLSYELLPADATTTLTWKEVPQEMVYVSGNNGVCDTGHYEFLSRIDVSENGLVTAKKAGFSSVRVTTSNGLTASCLVTVSKRTVELTALTLEGNFTLNVGESKQLSYTLTPDDAETQLTWTSDNENVVSVSQDGTVTAVASGSATITVTSDNGLSASVIVTVNRTQEVYWDDPENTLYFNNKSMDVCTKRGFDLPVYMKNNVEVSQIQFDLHLPEGFEVVCLPIDFGNDWYLVTLNHDLLTNSDHQVSVAKQENGAMRVVIFSPSNKTITLDCTTSPLVNIFLKLDDNVSEGTVQAYIDNIEMATPNADKYKTTIISEEHQINFMVCVSGSGDADRDGRVTVNDLTLTVQGILGTAGSEFNEVAADMDGDGMVSVTDIAALVNLILTQEAEEEEQTAGAKPCGMGEEDEEDDDVQIVPFTIRPGEEKEIEVNIESKANDYCQAQMDIVLPEGLSIVTNNGEPCVAPGSLVAFSQQNGYSHSVLAAERQNGTVRVVCFSMTNRTFAASQGSVAKLTVKADDNMAAGDYLLLMNNVELSRPDATKLRPSAQNTFFTCHDGVTTSISNAQPEQPADNTWYDLQGRRTDHPTRGIYIVNGKKVVKK